MIIEKKQKEQFGEINCFSPILLHLIVQTQIVMLLVYIRYMYLTKV